MSVYTMGIVWKHMPYTEPGKILTLIALADWADEDGFCYPSLPAICAKTSQAIRSVRRNLREFEADGWLQTDPGGGRQANHYRINLVKLLEVPARFGKGSKTPATMTGAATMAGHPGHHVRAARPPRPPYTVLDTSEDTMSLTLTPPPEQKVLITATATFDTIVQDVFDFYLKVAKKNPAVYSLTDSRRKKGMARLQDAIAMVDGDVPSAKKLMMLAVSNMAADPWHNGTKDGRKHMDWVDNLMRSTDQFEKVLTYE